MNSQIAWAYLVNFLSGEFRTHSEAAYLAFRIASNSGVVDYTPPVGHKL